MSVGYLDVVFNAATRWALVAGLVLFLLSRAKFFLAFRTHLGPALIVWIGWVSLTVLWSDVPRLSFLKAIGVAATIPAFVSAGMYWAQYRKRNDPLSYLAPLAALSLLAGLFGLGLANFKQARGLFLFEGLSSNANAFGILVAISVTYPLYAAHRAQFFEKDRFRAAAWSVVSLGLVVFLVMTRSRAALAVASCIGIAYGLAVWPRKFLVVSALAGVIAAGAAMTLPSVRNEVIRHATQFLAKGYEPDPFVSRRNVWQNSYNGAVRGGIIGLGIGVSADAAYFDGLLSSSEYGREKGNSQLAIIEETGLVGFAIYIFCLFRLFHYLAWRIDVIADRSDQIATALLMGALVGLVVHSVFEGWWTAPGSLEAIFFWTAAGAALGILRRAQAERVPTASGGAFFAAAP